MARTEGNLKLPIANADTIQYASSSTTVAGEVIYVAGLGTLIACDANAANATGTYYIKGQFRLPIVAGVTVAQGNRCYWDVSGNAVLLQSTTAFASGDFFVGTAVSAGTAAGGWVDVDLNVANTISAPSYVVIGYGTVATGAGASGTITVAGAQTTDKVVGTLLNGWTASTNAGASLSRCYVSAEDTVTYNVSGTGVGSTNGGVGVEVLRAV